MNKIKYIPWMAAAGMIASLAIILPASAQTTPTPATAQTGAPNGGSGGPGGHFGGDMRGGMHGMPPGVFGDVTAISGTTLTVTQKAWPNATSTTATAYTVDASNATIVKNGASSTLASVATGDMVMVQGTVTGDDVAATEIRDGMGGMMGGHGMGGPGSMGRGFGHGSSTPQTSPITGNGEPVVAGSITGISGTTITITNASNVTYTVDASNATIVKGGVSSTIASLETGDNLVVQGTVDGIAVTASSVIDQGSAKNASGTSGGGPKSGGGAFGFFGAIGSFFKRIFGF